MRERLWHQGSASSEPARLLDLAAGAPRAKGTNLRSGGQERPLVSSVSARPGRAAGTGTGAGRRTLLPIHGVSGAAPTRTGQRPCGWRAPCGPEARGTQRGSHRPEGRSVTEGSVPGFQHLPRTHCFLREHGLPASGGLPALQCQPLLESKTRGPSGHRSSSLRFSNPKPKRVEKTRWAAFLPRDTRAQPGTTGTTVVMHGWEGRSQGSCLPALVPVLCTDTVPSRHQRRPSACGLQPTQDHRAGRSPDSSCRKSQCCPCCPCLCPVTCEPGDLPHSLSCGVAHMSWAASWPLLEAHTCPAAAT